MDIFDVLTMIGGLCLFLFGMHQMGAYLEKFAGGSLKMLLGKMTSNKILGFLTGMLVTAVIQSSSATTVMVVGFVNSGLLSLRQAIGVIMGANVGTTVTAWILSLAGIDGGSFFMQMLKPTSFTPILALVGTVLIMMAKSEKKKDIAKGGSPNEPLYRPARGNALLPQRLRLPRFLSHFYLLQLSCAGLGSRGRKDLL